LGKIGAATISEGERLMSIEIRTTELERRVREGIRSGGFHDADELLTKALDALSVSAARPVATLDWSKCPAVESVPGKVSGAWVLKGTLMPVSAIFENIEAGANIDDLLEWFDGLDREQVKAVLEFAARSLDKPPEYVP